jgi:hypothetical protein
MTGIRQQRHRIGENPVDHLHYHQSDIESGGKCKGASETGRRMRVSRTVRVIAVLM